MHRMDNLERRIMLGESIRRRREAERLSQSELGLMVDSSQTYIWQIECGSANVSIGKLCSIADGLGVTVNSLVDF